MSPAKAGRHEANAAAATSARRTTPGRDFFMMAPSVICGRVLVGGRAAAMPRTLSAHCDNLMAGGREAVTAFSSSRHQTITDAAHTARQTAKPGGNQ